MQPKIRSVVVAIGIDQMNTLGLKDFEVTKSPHFHILGHFFVIFWVKIVSHILSSFQDVFDICVGPQSPSV